MSTKPNHLPPNEILADYASGAASPGVALVIASHLTYSPESRARVGAFETVGGALLADEPAVAMSASALDSIWSAIETGEAPAPAAAPQAETALPQPLRDALGGLDANTVPWQFRLPGVSEYVLPGYGSERVSLLRARPGAGIPQHTHEGTEITLILQGVMEDCGELYGPGDLAINAEEDDHRPLIMGDETCICLVVMDGNLRFTGRFSRALNLIAE
ncbi:MAG: ChrR family anti-sigma-E factor [Pseudomonadota bacterium]